VERKGLPTVAGVVALAMACAVADPPSVLTGVISQVSGVVRVSGPGVGPVPLATPWQIIQAGVTVTLPEGAAVGIVCSNRHFIRLQGPASWLLSERNCAAGKELTPAVYAVLAPHAGRFKVIRGLLVLEREMRGAADPRAPVILAPRNTVLRVPRPTVVWTRVPSAAEYLVEWNGRGAETSSTRLPAAGLSCAAAAEGTDACSLPWPAERPDLPPGGIFFLTIAVRKELVEPWHYSTEVKVQTLDLAAAGTLEGHLRDLESLGLEGAQHEAARAGLLAEAGVYSDAAEAYRRALALAPTPELRITLADIDSKIGFLRSAELLYLQAIAESDAAGQAAATFGLGRISYSRRRFREAAAQFNRARELYAGLKLKEEEVAAHEAEAEAEKRVPE